MHGLPVHFRDHFALLQTGVIGRTAGSDLLDHGAVNVVTGSQLLPEIRRQVSQPEAPARLAVTGVAALVIVPAFAHCLQRDWHFDRVAIAQGFEVQRGAGLLFSHFDLQFTRVGHWFAVEFGDDITYLQPRFRAWRVGSTWVMTAPEALFTWKKCASSGVTSLIPMPMYP